MITALCFINTTPEHISSAGAAIAQIEGVRSVYSVTGKIDLVAIIELTSSPLLRTGIPPAAYAADARA